MGYASIYLTQNNIINITIVLGLKSDFEVSNFSINVIVTIHTWFNEIAVSIRIIVVLLSLIGVLVSRQEKIVAY